MNDRKIPTFQSFLKQVPPLRDAEKPLPPVPMAKRRTSSSPIPRSKTPPLLQTRRSSSVYSRWDKDDMSWHSSDFGDQPPVPPLPMLQPLAYSSSTPELVQRRPTPPLLQPRAYSPPSAIPSSLDQPPTPSSLAPRKEWNNYVPAQSNPRPSADRVMKIIPLDKAIAAANTPGAIHLLPEEHRAQRMKRSRSQEAMNVAGSGLLSPASAQKLPEPLVLIDKQGRPRSIIPPRGDVNGLRLSSAAIQNDLSSCGTAAEGWACSNRTRSPAIESDDSEEPRGRTMQRGPKKTKQAKLRAADFAQRGRHDAETLACEYSALLLKQRDESLKSSRLEAADSNESLRLNMKMIPSPLFQIQPDVKSTKSATRFNENPTTPPYDLSSHHGSATSSSSSAPVEYFPGPYAPCAQRRHKRMSTSGSIPISPPTTTSADFPSQAESQASASTSKGANPQSSKYKKRASAFYPHVAPRKAKTKTKMRAHTAGKMSSVPQDISTLPLAPLKIRPACETLDEVRGRSSASSSKAHQPLMERLAKGAAKYADLLTRPDGLEGSDYTSLTASTTFPGSLHLTPKSSNTTPKAVHLGWSNTAKAVFDKSLAPTFNYTKPVLYTHVTTPARPLDESRSGLKDTETPRRKSSIFANFLDSWKESKAEKRRQDLKKTIKVFPIANGSVDVGLRRSSSFGWM